ncbi:vitamin K epoxide reductase family protein [Gammaproteobacteria bacterium AB-CW1]|uniref:Vitamin K epoxide reductase family protein n=1 Tax=Natronospira elongata TaxID=3110268 RepID=A0AAP6JES2_9GAMM|nr:vitamin K epoxide reductase family protein [Gammaproteobacteria bacterium AB-CW1]
MARKHRRKQQSASRSRRRSRSPKVQRQPDWPILGLAAFGMLITGWLTVIASTTGDMPLCAAGSGCDIILGSRWSTLFGVPVALFGFLAYALIAFVSFEMRPSVKRWRWQWVVALVGLTVSVYLTLLGLVELRALCPWCMTSLATIAAIFIWLTLKRPQAAPGGRWRDWLINTGSLAAVVVIIMQLHYSGLLTPGMGREDPELQALAQHLDESGARFYGAYWCPACQEQEDLFGASADRLPYVECHPRGRGGLTAAACITAGIESYPTWIIDGERHEGILSTEELSDLSGFRWRGED